MGCQESVVVKEKDETPDVVRISRVPSVASSMRAYK